MVNFMKAILIPLKKFRQRVVPGWHRIVWIDLRKWQASCLH